MGLKFQEGCSHQEALQDADFFRPLNQDIDLVTFSFAPFQLQKNIRKQDNAGYVSPIINS